MKLRDYQEKAVDSVFEQWEEAPSSLAVLATGLGKTAIAANIISRMLPKRSLFLADREELIFQAKETIERHAGIHCEIEMGKFKATQSLFSRDPVVISTVQTQISGNGTLRMEKFRPNDFGLVIIDEAHGAVSKTFKKTVEYYRQNPDIKILGLTATPKRHDEKALGQIFDTVACDYPIKWGRDNGWLVPVLCSPIDIEELDLSEIKATAGDLNGAQLAAVLEKSEIALKMVKPCIEMLGSDKQAIMFTESIAQSELCCDIFNSHRKGMAEWAHGGTDKDKRREIVRNYKEGKTQVIVNCDLWGKGFDAPNTDFIIIGRPTASWTKFMQWIGRGTRPIPGLVDMFDTAEERKKAIAESKKPNVTIVDFHGNSGRHKLVTLQDILGGDYEEEVVELAKKKAREYGKPVEVDEVLEAAQEEIKKKREEEKEKKREHLSRIVYQKAKVRYVKRSVDPFDVLGITPMRERGWDRGKKLTEKQQAVLVNCGIKPETLSYSKAKQLIGEIFKRRDNKQCTFKQAKKLKQFDYSTDVTFKEASAIIDALAANGWRKPEPVAADIDCPF